MDITEILKPDFVLPDSQIVAQNLERVSKGGENSPRFYLLRDRETGDIHCKGMGITSFIDLVLPKGIHFEKWLRNSGEQGADYSKIRMEFGSMLHQLKSELTQCGEMDISYEYLKFRVPEFVSNKYQAEAAPFLIKMQEALLSWAQFIVDKEYEPLAIEVSCLSPTMGLAATLDDIGTMKVGRTRKHVIIDTKSFFKFNDVEKKEFQTSHEMQLAFQKRIFQEVNPNFTHDIEIFNWAPNAWKKTPTYELKNQTSSVFNDERMVQCYLTIGELQGLTNTTFVKKKLGGVIRMDEFDAAAHIESFTY